MRPEVAAPETTKRLTLGSQWGSVGSSGDEPPPPATAASAAAGRRRSDFGNKGVRRPTAVHGLKCARRRREDSRRGAPCHIGIRTIRGSHGVNRKRVAEVGTIAAQITGVHEWTRAGGV